MERQIALKHMKRCSASLRVKECNLKKKKKPVRTSFYLEPVNYYLAIGLLLTPSWYFTNASVTIKGTEWEGWC